jgi:hypothetical protein
VKRQIIAPAVALAVLLTAGAGTAAAQGSQQLAEQSAGTGQSASSNASSTQVNPTNSNISVRIGSPGNNGSVNQSNSSSAASAAGNAALTDQSASQSGGSGVQGVLQNALTHQSASSNAESTQVNPTNSNIDVRIGSPGDNGNVNQSNSSDAQSLAGNVAKTEQAAQQDQGGGGCCHGGSGVQAAEQNAATKQDADSNAESKQIHPTNENTSVRIDKPHGGKCGCKDDGYATDMSGGKNGNVTQSNDSSAVSFAGNAAKTEQAVAQTQDGSCGCHGDLVQAAGQWAYTHQDAKSNAESEQKGAKNSNTPVRLFSGGDDGNVNQSNSSEAASFAGNLAFTGQAVEQDQSGSQCGCRKVEDKRPAKGYESSHCCSNGVQGAGQWANTYQDANSNAESKQIEPTNSSTPVRLGSYGGGGSVSQSNSSYAKSKAFNLAATLQYLTQVQ